MQTINNQIFTNGGGISNNQLLNNSKSRLDYIDILKGITIFCIIWCHTDSPSALNEWSLGTIGNIFFFILSGFFFKPSTIKEFLDKKVKTIIIPFLFFYLISLPFRFIVDLWDYRTIYAFDWNRILDIFKIEERSDYLSLNVPLWFLLTLFIIQLLSNYLFKLPKYFILILAISSFILKDYLLNWSTPFMFNNALYWFGFFSIGYLIGKPLIKLFKEKKKIYQILGFSIALFFISLLWIDILAKSDFMNLILHLRHISFFIVIFSVISLFPILSKIEILKFFGLNTIIILGAHLWFLIPIGRISYLITKLHEPWIGFILSVLCAVALIPLINFINHRFPFIIGKSPIRKESVELA